jgi:guanylate kinase
MLLIPRGLASAARLSRAAAMGQRASSPAGAGAAAVAPAAGRAAARKLGGGTTANGSPPSALPPTTSTAPLSDGDLERALGQPLSRQPMAPPPRPLVLVVSGPSGVGKDAVLQRLRARRPNLRFVVTATTRARRPQETDGVDYHFVSREAFERWITNGELLEHALVYGEYKGIPRAQVSRALSAGEDVVLRLDVQGAATVRRLLSQPQPDGSPPIPHATVFIVAESQAALARRLAARGTEDRDALKRRFAEAEAECARLGEFDYVIVNRDGRLEECVDALGSVIDAHKARVAPVASAVSKEG